MDYEDYYNNAKRRYYEACSGISDCENRISDLKSQRQQKINLINRLNNDIKKTQDALDGMMQIVKSDEHLNQKILDVTNKTSKASVNFVSMVSAPDVSIKNLDDAYSAETTNTKRTLSDILKRLKAKKNTLISKLADLQDQLRCAESDKQDIENSIRSTEISFADWKNIKRNASYDMEYNRRKMQEAV